MVVLETRDRGHFMKNFRFDTICNITEELQELNCFCGFIGNSTIIKYLIAVKSLYKLTRFDQLATTFSVTSLKIKF